MPWTCSICERTHKLMKRSIWSWWWGRSQKDPEFYLNSCADNHLCCDKNRSFLNLISLPLLKGLDDESEEVEVDLTFFALPPGPPRPPRGLYHGSCAVGYDSGLETFLLGRLDVAVTRGWIVSEAIEFSSSLPLSDLCISDSFGSSDFTSSTTS